MREASVPAQRDEAREARDTTRPPRIGGRWLLSLREIKAGEEIPLTKGWAFYQQVNPVAASATEQ